MIHSLMFNYEIACLETVRETFYDRLGRQTWQGPLAKWSVDGSIPTPGQNGIMIPRLPRTPLLDL